MLDYFYFQHEIKKLSKKCYQLLFSKIVPLRYLQKRYSYDYLQCANKKQVLSLLKKSLINSALFPSVFQKMNKQQKELLLLSFVDDLAVLFNRTFVKGDSWWYRYLWHYSAPEPYESGYRCKVEITLETGIMLRINLAEPLIDKIAAVMHLGLNKLIIQEYKYINLILITKHFKELNSGLSVTRKIQSFIEKPRKLLINYPRLDKCRYSDLLMIRKLDLQKNPINSKAKEKINYREDLEKKQERELTTIRKCL